MNDVGRAPFFNRTALAIWIAATFGAACVLPYVNALTPHMLRAASVKLGAPVSVVIAISLVQSAITLGLLSYTGLWAARRLGLGAPLLDAWLTRGAAAPSAARRGALVPIVAGLASGLALSALDIGVFSPMSPDGVGRLLHQPQPSPLIGFLASFEGGITEEVELRLILLSFLALGLRYVGTRGKGGPLSAGVFWSANIVAAVLFGLGHLPITAKLVPLTPIIVARAITLNGIVGLVAGSLYQRRGIEMAMLCHFSADLVLHVALPPLIPLLSG
jgi:hypothetical protein